MRSHSPLITIPLSLALAFVFATSWVAVMTWSLPRSDMAYGSSPFGDPLVLPVMSVLATLAGLATAPFVHLALRHRRLAPGAGIAAGTTLLFIAVLTPINAGLGFLGSFLGYAVGLLLARRYAPLNVGRGHCRRCGYDRRSLSTERPCPECGGLP